MLLSVSLALIFAAITGVLIWAGRVSVSSAVAVWLSGFTAAATVVAGPVHALLSAAVSAFH
ncbi:hypothetical protein [Kitasatospora camelliae]|uniref:Uncharacterized protein n=1 Tax=Kitasatospora camelliae TaxID=3156397 RepID=A0AAU8K3Z0_9ACTN